MSYYSYSAIIIILVINPTFVWTAPSILQTKSVFSRNGTSLNIRDRISAQADKTRNITSSIRDRYESPHEEQAENDDESSKTSVVVLTSLSGIYVWWPIIFGGDDSFHLLLTQEEVPRFHDVAGDNYGHIYLTAPHERTVYRLQYSDGWWISNFSNHSVMNSIRSEMPLFCNVHYISSMLYVYGHSDIQIIDLLQRTRIRGSAPFMTRLRELSPNLRISDMIIDQLTSDGYIIGDSYGWCTVIRCSLGVNECIFLFKIPSSYDNRPYPCTATIDFSNKIIYLSLEDKILLVYLNEQTNYDRRQVLTEKHGQRSTLGYDDIVTYNNAILYTDVLRPILHICTLTNSNPCLNISLTFPPPLRSILPLRLSIVQVSNLRPPILEDDDDDIELHINQSSTIPPPAALLQLNTTTLTKSSVNKEVSVSNIWMLLFGICAGLLVAGICFLIYYIIWNKNRPKLKKDHQNPSTLPRTLPRVPLLKDDRSNEAYTDESNTENLSEITGTTSSSSYRPNTIV